jgi:glycosyltransferase involved in cell wall biosynthesis
LAIDGDRVDGDALSGYSAGVRRAVSNQRHICVVTETYPPEVNGVALTLAHLVRGLLAQGHSVSVARPHQQRFDVRGYSQASELTLVRGLPVPGYRGLQFGLPACRLLCRSWKRSRPDAVYVATEGPLGWSALRVARRLGIPVLTGFHTNFHSYSKHYRLGWLQDLIFRYLRGFHNRSTGTIVATPDLRERLEAFGFKNVSILGRGVDNELFAPERRSAELRRHWGVSDNDLAVLYVGRIAPEKNVKLAVDAYRAMKQRSGAVKFVVVGNGPACGALQRENADLIFCGQRTGEQLATHYASADVFLFPSETETFGNVTLEAMASGLVVIAYDYAAARMHIRHDETGVLLPYGDSTAFVGSAARLASDRLSLAKMRRQAREYVSSIEWRYVVERFEMLLTGACYPNEESPHSLDNMPRFDQIATGGRI